MSRTPRSQPGTDTDPVAKAARMRSALALEHELQVHQAELEMQNEELRRTQLDLAHARDRFIDLYDFAPVGYMTLDRDSRIAEVNLTGAAMLGIRRTLLVGRPLNAFMADDDASRWKRHVPVALRTEGATHIELAIRPPGGTPLQCQLDCLRVASNDTEPQLRVALIDISHRKLSERNQRMAARAVEAGELERRRVARELHEDLGQRLSALKMNLADFCREPGSSARGQRATEMLETLDDAVAIVRRVAAELRPLMLDDLGLNAAVDWLARDSERRLGMRVTLRMDEGDPPLGENLSIGLYRLLHDALAHIARHARATDVSVDLRWCTDELVLTLRGSGSGWPHLPIDAGAMSSEAMETLREQTHLMGGSLQLDRQNGSEHGMVIRLPLTHDTVTGPAEPALRGQA